MSKIYLAAFESNAIGPGFHGFALAEDGTGICGHYSSSIDFAKHDLGLNSDWKHEFYKMHYPDGYELEWVSDPDNHPGWRMAFRRNQVMKNCKEHEC